jgi:NodT family efflux transporter outer membrane factor (OMF) lipoprotein
LDITAAGGRGTGSNSTRGRIGAPLNAGTNTKGLDEITHVAGFDAAWELDLFGGISRAIEAARADVQVAEEDRKQVLVSVVADTVRTYADLRSLQVRLRIARDNVAAQQRTVDLVRVRLDRGLGNELDVVLAERQLSSALARIAPLEASVREAERRIAVLLGRPPQDLYAELDAPGLIPGLGAETDIGVPLELVRRRPDIRRAERQIAASNARIGVATAQLFPQVAITAGLGFQGQGLGVTPVTNSLIWSIGPSVRWPILDFGRVDAQIQQQTFRTRELLLVYRKTVLQGIEEVENAMSGYAAQRNRLEQLTVAVASSQQAVNLATQRFDLGLTDFLNVLDAQRQLYDLQDQLATSQQAAATQLIALYKSLGGGWEQYRAPAPPPGPQPAVVAMGREIVGARK